MTYTLTTDLIADCMVLIPQNLKLVNESDKYFFSSDCQVELLYQYNEYQRIRKVLDEHHSTDKFLIISHCLRTIPEFQAENPAIAKYQAGKTTVSKLKKQYEYDFISYTKESILDTVRYLNKELNDDIARTPKTIAAATLHGQGEFPPSTLEELCESYKNVMSN